MTLTAPSSKALRFIAIRAAILLVVACGLLIPNWRELNAADDDIISLKGALHEQEVLAPLFQRLLDKRSKDVPAELSIPEPQRFPKASAGRLRLAIASIARKASLTLMRFDADIESYVDGSDELQVSTELRGDYLALHRYLTGLAQYPYMKHIDSVRVRSASPTPTMMVRFSILVETN